VRDSWQLAKLEEHAEAAPMTNPKALSVSAPQRAFMMRRSYGARHVCVKPRGAFYLFPDISGLLSPDGLRTSADFAQAIIEKEHVVVTPGEAFDAPGYLRISYATSMEQLREGADRILRFAETLQPKAAASR
jgi:aspartate/methionine/tyrosine aminotransferase